MRKAPPAHCESVVEENIEARSASKDVGLNDAEKQLIETVMKSLEGRSPGVKQALEKALLNGQSASDQHRNPVGCASPPSWCVAFDNGSGKSWKAFLRLPPDHVRA